MKTASCLLLVASLSGMGLCAGQKLKIVVDRDMSPQATKLGAPKLYKLKKQARNADFPDSTLKDLDQHLIDASPVHDVTTVFDPIEGTFNYYQFTAAYRGEGYNVLGPEENFYDILIVKTDKANKIVDAYQHTLNWAEPPLQADLYRSSKNGEKLVNGFDVSRLGLVRTYVVEGDTSKPIQEGGIILLSR